MNRGGLFVLRGLDDEIKSRPLDCRGRSPSPAPSPLGQSETKFKAQVKKERALNKTPRASDQLIENVCGGAPFVRVPAWMKVLGYVLPVVMFLSVVLLFVFPPCAVVFVASAVGYWYVRRETKRFIEIGERNRPVPKFTCPTPVRNMLY